MIKALDLMVSIVFSSKNRGVLWALILLQLLRIILGMGYVKASQFNFHYPYS